VQLVPEAHSGQKALAKIASATVLAIKVCLTAVSRDTGRDDRFPIPMQLMLHLGQAQVLVLAFLFEQRETMECKSRRELRRGSVAASVRKGVAGMQNAATNSVLGLRNRNFPHTPQISYLRRVGLLLSRDHSGVPQPPNTGGMPTSTLAA
jgi:hypothetical protein